MSEEADASACTTRVVPVDGMHCAACAAKVERALRGDEAVATADVSFASRSARISFDPARTDLERLAMRVRKSGFSLLLGRDPKLRAEREAAEARDLHRRFVVGAMLSAPLAAIAMTHGAVPWLAGREAAWIQCALAAPVYLWCGWPIHRAALARARAFSTDMNTLVALGTTIAFAASVRALVAPGAGGADASGHAAGHAAGHALGHAAGHAPHLWFEAAAIIIVFVLLGRLLEARAMRRARAELGALGSLAVASVRVVETRGATERESEIDADAVEAGMRVRIRPGERVPVDGVVVAGTSEVDASMLTGEPVPVVRGVGEQVSAGMVNTIGVLDVVASCATRETVLARISAMVDEAQATKARIARTADRVAAVFVPAILLVAFASFAAWMLLSPPEWTTEMRLDRALEALIGVLVVACPCALGLATPIAVMVASGRAATHGVLFRTASSFEKLAGISTLVVDKTGTLTQGRLRVSEVRAAEGFAERDVLALAAEVERSSEHPIARGIAMAAAEHGFEATGDVAEFRAIAGEGACARVRRDGEKRLVRVGRRSWLAAEGVRVPDEIAVEGRATRVGVAIDGRFVGEIALEDALRPEAAPMLEAARARGIAVWIASGDARAPVVHVAGALGIPEDRIRHDLSPGGKAELVRTLRARGPVGFVGDGINDALALAAADAGVAMSGGADIAKGSADVVLFRGDLGALMRALDLSRATLAVIRQNLAWAFGYNLLLVPLAAGVLAPSTGIMLPPVAASIAMALSSLTVVANGLRLRRA
jgi:Cu+-exporting ATPase